MNTTSVLLRHVLRAMSRIRLRLLTITLICASTFGVMVGAYSALDSLFRTVETRQDQANMADLELLFATDDPKNVPDFSHIKGVSGSAMRLLVPGRLTFSGQRAVSALFVGAPDAQFSHTNRLRLLQGSLPSDDAPSQVAIERNCASHYQLEPGARLSLKSGSAIYALRVSGVVESPEYLVAPLNPGIYVPTSGSLCVLFGAQKLFHDALGFAATNSLLIHFNEDQAENDSILQQAILSQAQTRLTVDHALLRSEQFSQKFLQLDLNTFKVFLPGVVLIYALSSTLVVFFLMNQWIRTERAQIAMLLTLGYDRQRIAMAYLLPAGLISLMAVLLGLLLAWIDCHAFGINYAQAIGMPRPELSLQSLQIFLALLSTVATVAAGMYLPLHSLQKMTPVRALREMPGNRHQRIAESMQVRIHALGGPHWLQYALRNLSRHWAMTLVSSVAIAASLAVTIAFYISLTSMERTALASIQQDPWLAVVDFDAPLWDDERRLLEQAVPDSLWSLFVKGGVQIYTPGRLDNALLTGFDPADKVRRPHLLAGRMLLPSESAAVVLERRLAADHGLDVGDQATLKAHGNTFTATVVGILSGAVPGEVLTSRSFAQNLLAQEQQFTGAFLLAPDLSASSRSELSRVRGVLRVTGKAEVKEAILSISAQIWVIIHLSALMSIAVATLFYLSSTGFSIIDRRNEYGMLRILGYSDFYIARLVLAEALILALLATLMAAPAGWLLGSLLNARLTEVWFHIRTDPAASDFLRILLPALLVVPVAIWPALHSIFRTAAIETLKDRKLA